MGKRFKVLLTMLFMFMVGVLVWRPDPVMAANPTVGNLIPNMHFYNYDITGDKKPDSLIVQTINGKGKIYVNDEYCGTFQLGEMGEVEVRIYTLKNGAPFLYLYSRDINYYGPTCGLFQFRSGKMVQVINFNNILKKGYEYYCENIKVKDNSITATIFIMSYTLGVSSYDFDYVYRNGTLKQKSALGTINITDTQGKPLKKLIVNKTLNAYSKVSGGKKSFTLKKENKVKYDKIYHGTYGEWIRVKFKGKYGWIKCTDHALISEPKMFSNIMYAG